MEEQSVLFLKIPNMRQFAWETKRRARRKNRRFRQVRTIVFANCSTLNVILVHLGATFCQKNSGYGKTKGVDYENAKNWKSMVLTYAPVESCSSDPGQRLCYPFVVGGHKFMCNLSTWSLNVLSFQPVNASTICLRSTSCWQPNAVQRDIVLINIS